MAKTVIDVDDDALALAAEELGTRTKVETINTALQEIARRRAVRRELEFARDGGYADLLDPEVMNQAWR